jgi:salicylate hydroxylase
MINFVAFSCRHDLENTKFDGPWVGPGDKTQFGEIFAHWEPEVQALLYASIVLSVLAFLLICF